MSQTSPPKKPTYTVGYGRPPEHARFKKGRSGNPTGRRRYSDSERGKQLLREEASRVLTLREGNRVEKITAMRAAVRSLFIAAAKGKTAALKLVLQATDEMRAPESNDKAQKILDFEKDLNLRKLTDSELEELSRLLWKAYRSDDETQPA